MKINGTQSQIVNIEVRDSDIIKAAIDIIRAKAGLGHDQWVADNGDLMEEIDHPHRSYDEKVGVATLPQLIGYKLCEELKKFMY